MRHRNLAQVCEVRAYQTDTHSGKQMHFSLQTAFNATNTAAGQPGSNTLGPSYQRKPANTHERGHTSDLPPLHVRDSCNDRELSSELGATLPELYFKRSLSMDLMSSITVFVFFYSLEGRLKLICTRFSVTLGDCDK